MVSEEAGEACGGLGGQVNRGAPREPQRRAGTYHSEARQRRMMGWMTMRAVQQCAGLQ